MKNDVLFYIDNLPLLPYEVAEVKAAYERSLHYSWVQAREEIKKLSESRIDEKHEKKIDNEKEGFLKFYYSKGRRIEEQVLKSREFYEFAKSLYNRFYL